MTTQLRNFFFLPLLPVVTVATIAFMGGGRAFVFVLMTPVAIVLYAFGIKSLIASGKKRVATVATKFLFIWLILSFVPFFPHQTNEPGDRTHWHLYWQVGHVH